MMFKEKYSKLYTDRISVSLSPLMSDSKTRLKVKSNFKQNEWVEEEPQDFTLGLEHASGGGGGGGARENSSFWDTEF